MIKKIGKLQEPPKLAIKFANTVFVLGFLFCLLTAVYASYRIFNPIYDDYLGNKGLEAFYIISIICGGVFATLFGLGLKRLNNNLKVNLSVLFFTICITVYGFETYLEFSKKNQREIIAKQMSVPYDTRTRTEVLDDLRNSGVKAFPNSFPGNFIRSNGFTTKIGRIYPLGTISNSTTILTNEGGYYPIIETDEHGFNNPKGLYIENKVDIVLTGDSFTEGQSVYSEESISAVLRQLDFNAISLGKGGNGSLIEFAALKEYAKPLKSKIVLWLYYVNDLDDLAREMESSILRKYLNEDDYSQNLISRQEEIDGVLKNYVQSEWVKERERERKKKEKRIINLLKLSKLRNMSDLKPKPKPTLTTPKPIFRNILQKANQMVLEWGGKMYFVRLSEFTRNSTGNEHKDQDWVMKTVTELYIPIIDIHLEVFNSHPDSLSLFPFRINGHYNAEGYRLVAEVIRKRIEKDGLLH